MRYCLSQAKAQITGLGLRPLTFGDLHFECEQRSILLCETRMQTIHGITWSDDEGTYICLNKNLYREGKLFAGWHELGHVLLHPTHQQTLLSRGRWTNHDRWEAEADAVAVVALLPFPPEGHAAETNLEWARYRLFQTYGV